MKRKFSSLNRFSCSDKTGFTVNWHHDRLTSNLPTTVVATEMLFSWPNNPVSASLALWKHLIQGQHRINNKFSSSFILHVTRVKWEDITGSLHFKILKYRFSVEMEANRNLLANHSSKGSKEARVPHFFLKSSLVAPLHNPHPLHYSGWIPALTARKSPGRE